MDEIVRLALFVYLPTQCLVNTKYISQASLHLARASGDGPIRGQHTGHVICLDQSEVSISPGPQGTGDKVIISTAMARPRTRRPPSLCPQHQPHTGIYSGQNAIKNIDEQLKLTRRSILGSDCIDSYFDALIAL